LPAGRMEAPDARTVEARQGAKWPAREHQTERAGSESVQRGRVLGKGLMRGKAMCGLVSD
jgi:hypothetical protein